MTDAELGVLAAMVDEADRLDGDPDLELEPDLEDSEGQLFIDDRGNLSCDAWMLRQFAVHGWHWDLDYEMDSSAEQVGEPAWLE